MVAKYSTMGKWVNEEYGHANELENKFADSAQYYQVVDCSLCSDYFVVQTTCTLNQYSTRQPCIVSHNSLFYLVLHKLQKL